MGLKGIDGWMESMKQLQESAMRDKQANCETKLSLIALFP